MAHLQSMARHLCEVARQHKQWRQEKTSEECSWNHDVMEMDERCWHAEGSWNAAELCVEQLVRAEFILSTCCSRYLPRSSDLLGLL